MISTAVLLAALVVGTGFLWRRGARGAAMVCALCATLPTLTLAQELPWPLWIVVLGACGFWMWNRWSRSAGIVTRWSARTRRKSGVASRSGHRPHRLGRRDAPPRRHRPPSLAGLSAPGAPAARPPPKSGVQLCQTAWQSVWCLDRGRRAHLRRPAGGQDRTARLAGAGLPRRRARHLDSHRPALDLRPAARRSAARCTCSTPSGSAASTSTITFDPLTGCTDPVTAVERATDMLAATSRAGSGDREFWDAQARRVLAALLHAAALGGKTMADVLAWVAKPGPGRAGRPRAAAPLRGGGVRDRRRAVRRHQRPHPNLDHLHGDASAGLADPPGRRGRRPARGRVRRRRAVARAGRRCSCSAPRKPRPPRWSAR